MTTLITQGDLLNLHRQLESWKASKNALFYLLSGKISSFYNENGVRLSAIIERYTLINKTFFQTEKKEVNGKEVEDFIYEGEGKDRKPALHESYTLEEYQKVIEEFMSEKLSVKI